MEAKEWLSRYGPLYRETAALMKRLKVLEESACIVDPAELDEIEARCKKNLEEMAAIRTAINMLDDPLEREVLHLRYTDGADGIPPKWKVITKEIFGSDDSNSEQNAMRLHRRALEHLGQMVSKQNKASHPVG